MNTTKLELDVQSLSHDGRGVCRDDQRVVFVRGALPGQRVLAALTTEKKRFAEGHCLKIIRAAEGAVAAPCPHAESCGGCPLQTMPYDQQLLWKGRIVSDALTRIGKVTLPDESPLVVQASPRPWGYRNKMEFAFGTDDSGALCLGLREGGSHAVTSADKCMLMPSLGRDALDLLRKCASESGLPAWDNETGEGFWRYAILRMPETPGPATLHGPQRLLTCITSPGSAQERAMVKRMGEQLLAADHGVSGFVHAERGAASMLAQGEKVVSNIGLTKLVERLGGISYDVDHAGFFQVNTGAAELLCATVVKMANLGSREILWDLYCGVGAPGLALMASAEKKGGGAHLYGVESHAGAVAMAGRNAKKAGLSDCTYETGDAAKATKDWPKPQLVLVDPPRAGLHPDVVQRLLKVEPSRIVYVSCNPATLARDVALLTPKYALTEVAAVDLFPQTPHVESVVLLTRRG